VKEDGLYITPDGHGKALVTKFSDYRKYKYSKPELCWTIDWPIVNHDKIKNRSK